MVNKAIDFNKKTILITGGAGFIGSNLVFHFQENYPQAKIIVFDCFRNKNEIEETTVKNYGHFKNLLGFNGQVITGNINDKDDLQKLNTYKFDYIFHKAAITDTRFENQEIIMRTNVNSFYEILNLTQKNHASLVYASSAATYGNSPPPQEVGGESPENPYGFSKYLMDNVAMSFSRNNPDINIVGLRYFNVYGEKEFFKGSTASMILQLALQILEGETPRLFYESDNIKRDFVYIEDVIQANIKACYRKKNGIFNVGTGKARSFQEIANILQKELETNLGTEYFENPYSAYQENTQANIDETTKQLGYKPKFSLEKGIKKYLPEIIRLHKANKKYEN